MSTLCQEELALRGRAPPMAVPGKVLTHRCARVLCWAYLRAAELLRHAAHDQNFVAAQLGAGVPAGGVEVLPPSIHRRSSRRWARWPTSAISLQNYRAALAKSRGPRRQNAAGFNASAYLRRRQLVP